MSPTLSYEDCVRNDLIREFNQETAKLRTLLKEAGEALDYYGEIDHYDITCAAVIFDDRGARARSVLQKIKAAGV